MNFRSFDCNTTRVLSFGTSVQQGSTTENHIRPLIRVRSSVLGVPVNLVMERVFTPSDSDGCPSPRC